MDKELIQKVMTQFYEANADWKCEGIQTEHTKGLSLVDYTITDERSLVKGIVEDVGEELLQYLYDSGYLAHYLLTTTWYSIPASWGTIIGKFCVDTGLTRTTSCYKCSTITVKHQATEVSEGKFHCDNCGHIFEANICPNCGGKLDLVEPKGEPFTAYYVCPCGFHTEAPQ